MMTLRCNAFLMLAVLLAIVGPPRIAHAQAGKVTDTLEQRLLACAACHGKQGEGISRNEYFPRLAGKPAGYLFNQLVDFRDRRRESPIMSYLLSYLSDAYLRDIAGYYAGLHPPYPPPVSGASSDRLARGGLLVTEGDNAAGIPACTACHGKALTGMEPAIPGLVGLDPHYVAAQMGAWRTGQRRARAPDCMHEIASRLSTEDIAAVAAWLSSQSASTNARPAPEKSLKPPIDCGSAP